MRSNNLTPCSTISSSRSSLKRASALSTPSRRHPSTAPHPVSCDASSLRLGIARSLSIGSSAVIPISRSLRHRPLQAARDRKRLSRARPSSGLHHERRNAVSLLHPESRQNSRRFCRSALCQKRTFALQQKTPLFGHLVDI